MPSADVQRRLVAVDRQLSELRSSKAHPLPDSAERLVALESEKAALLAELRQAHAGTPAAKPR